MTNNIANPWTKGTTYPPNSTVRPTYVTGSSANPPTNGDFETADLSGWTSSGGFVIASAGSYSGGYCASLPANAGLKTLTNNNQAATPTGPQVSASCYVNFGAITAAAAVRIGIAVYNSNLPTHGLISITYGPYVYPATIASANGWKGVSVSNVPMLIGTAYAAVVVEVTNNSAAGPILIDNVAWDLLLNPFNANQLFYAVQPATGKSGQIEPVWRDTTTGGNINDGTVIWSSQAPNSILWVGEPMLKSGSVEPNWPTQPGLSVLEVLSVNQNLSWIAVTPQVVDPNDPTLPPQTKYMFIAASKVWALDGDNANYSATMNPLDWTSEANAGFLPIGQRAFGGTPFVAAGVYRSNAVFMNPEGLQMWQLDEDPANMALLDAIPIGCSQHRSIASVNDDMLFLSLQGVRSMGISVGSSNLQSGDVGMPVDPLVQPAMVWATANGVTPIGGYFPSLGKYFLAFPGWPADNLFWSSGGSGVTTNVGNAFSVVIPTAPVMPAGGPDYRAGCFFCITFNAAATGPATLNINGRLAAPVQPYANITAGSTWFVTYDPNSVVFTITEVTRIFVYTMGRTGEVGSWSHYSVQYMLEDFCMAADGVYMRGTRAGAPHVFRFDATAQIDTNASGNFQTFGVVQWPWLDDGTPGVNKQLSGIDMAVTQLFAVPYFVEIGYDQTDKNAFTQPYQLNGDTMTGMMYPFQVKAPSFAMRLVFSNDSGWSMQCADLYLTDKRITS